MPNNSFLAEAQEWAYALGRPACHATIRTQPEDFIVDEVLGYGADGEGNHAFLHIRKRNTNTEWLARQLAELTGVALSEVGYAGLKDRHALTSQYFSVNLSGKPEPDWHALESEDISVLDVDRHRRKLRRGRLLKNIFQLTLRDLQGDCDGLESRLQRVAQEGVPNYFGLQRFGHGGNNLEKARALFAGEVEERDRHKRGLYLSAARSWLFNRLLSQRVEQGSWNRALAGESVITDGTTSAFSIRLISGEIEQKIEQGKLHPSGPLWGRGKPTSLADAQALELALCDEEASLCDGLARAGLEQERRTLRVQAGAIEWQRTDNSTLKLHFALPAGAYATTLLRELVVIHDPHSR